MKIKISRRYCKVYLFLWAVWDYHDLYSVHLTRRGANRSRDERDPHRHHTHAIKVEKFKVNI